MRTTIDPGIDRPTIFLLDHIVYSHVQNLGGQPLDLDLSLMLPLQNNGEMRRIFGNNQPEERPDATTAPQAAKPAAPKRPVILWFNGNGFRGIDKNCQVADLEFLAEAGYAVAFVQVRSSAQGHLPAQLIDAKTAIRFLRANAGKYNLDPLRFGVAGRSAGGMIVSMLGLNDNRFLSEEWKGYSSDVQAVWDLFGLVDMAGVTEEQVEAYRNGTADTSRWSRMEDTHTGAVLGGDVDTMAQRAREYSVIRYIHGNMPPFLIMHGDADPMIPLEQSEMLYNSMLSWEGSRSRHPGVLPACGAEDRTGLFCPEYVNREKGERQWNTVSMGRMSSSGWTGARRSWTASGRSAKRNTSFWAPSPGSARSGK